MEQKLIGREAELKLLNEYINSDKSEFIAVYGRRRVGKTFLIRKAVEDHFAFFMTGMNGVAKGEQLVNFSISLQKYTHSTTLQTFKSWLLAFYALSQYIETLPEGKKSMNCHGWIPPNRDSYLHWKTSGTAGLYCATTSNSSFADPPPPG